MQELYHQPEEDVCALPATVAALLPRGSTLGEIHDKLRFPMAAPRTAEASVSTFGARRWLLKATAGLLETQLDPPSICN